MKFHNVMGVEDIPYGCALRTSLFALREIWLSNKMSSVQNTSEERLSQIFDMCPVCCVKVSRDPINISQFVGRDPFEHSGQTSERR